MLQLERILVGVDFHARDGAPTAGTRAALELALLVAARGARLTLVHSTAGDVVWRPLVGRVKLVSEGLSAAGQASLARLAQEARERGCTCEVALDEERPHLALLRRAVRERAQLVVVGKHEEDADGHKLGKVARKVLHMCAAPVLAAKPPAPKRLTRVLAATDLSPVGTRAVQLAGELAAASGAAFDVVHAFPFPLQDQFEPEDLLPGWHAERVRELAAEARAHLRESLAKVPAGERAELHLANGAPEGVIEEAIERWTPDLLVLGAVSRGGIAGLLVGSTAERLLERVPCSLLAIKPVDFVSPIEA